MRNPFSFVISAGCLALSFFVTGSLTSVYARDAIPFRDAGQDGYVLVLWGEHYTEEQQQSILDRIAKTKATHLTIPLFGCQTDLQSSDVGSCQVGPSQEYVFKLAALAKNRAFNVSILPIMVTKNWEWRGFFDPKDVPAWFKNYTIWIRQIARQANALGASEFVVASEITKLYPHTKEWKQILAEVRQDFSGPLIMAVNWGDTNQGFWDDADAIGISAYYPLSQRDNPSQFELDRSWRNLQKELLSVASQWNRPLHFTEIGYPSSTTAAQQPWLINSEASSDPELQARCYEAFRKAWQNDRALVRANIWATGDLSSPSVAIDHEVLGKPAEASLDQFFTRRLARRR